MNETLNIKTKTKTRTKTKNKPTKIEKLSKREVNIYQILEVKVKFKRIGKNKGKKFIACIVYLMC